MAGADVTVGLVVVRVDDQDMRSREGEAPAELSDKEGWAVETRTQRGLSPRFLRQPVLAWSRKVST